MRGGPPRASMKLDNRPKKLLVKGANADQVQSVRDWYEVRRVVLAMLACLCVVFCVLIDFDVVLAHV